MRGGLAVRMRASQATPLHAGLFICIVLMLMPGWVTAASFNATNASMEELVGWAQRTGTTVEKKENRALARAELFARGGEGLRYLMGNVQITNESIRILVDEMVRSQMPPSNSAPVLAEFLDAEQPATRRVAAYYLGFSKAVEFAPRLLPLLDDEMAKGASARTLGKWKIRDALPGVTALLASDKEPRRVVAVNALRDIGDPAAVPVLVGVLGDPMFTVRKAAARALATFGPAAEKALIRAMPASGGVAQREMVRTLGVMKARGAVKALKKMLRGAEGGLAVDIREALREIQE